MGLFQSKIEEATLNQERENRQKQLWRDRELEREYEEQRRELLRRQAILRRQQELRQQELRRQQENFNIWGGLEASLANLHIKKEPTHRGFVVEIKRDPELTERLLNCVGQNEWADKIYGGSVFVLETLDSDSYESIQQRNHFRESNKPCFKVTHVQKMFNPYLFLQFKLKEKQYLKKHHIVQIMKMYHGTKSTNIKGICVNNLDWRKNGTSTGHKFGQGVSFSPYSNYATHYGDKKSYRKVMFAVDILVGESCPGEGNTVIPEGNADTTVNDKGSVYVKYEDNAFYPTYLITYEGFERKNYIKGGVNNSFS